METHKEDQRQFVVEYIKEQNINILNKDIYEFGVYTGGSFIKFQRLLMDLQLKCRNIYGFDSFKGLPKKEGMFNKKDFNALKNFNKDITKQDSIKNIIKTLKQRISFSDIPTYFISGFFKDVLNDSLVLQYDFKSAIFIDIDVDIYSSTIECLEFMFQNNLIEKDTIIAYDDWGAFKEFTGGESKAHIELMKKYNTTVEEIFKYQNPNYLNSIQTVFIVRKIK